MYLVLGGLVRGGLVCGGLVWGGLVWGGLVWGGSGPGGTSPQKISPGGSGPGGYGLGVWLGVWSGGGLGLGSGTPPQIFFFDFFLISLETPPGSRLRHMVNERPVRILLECILVLLKFHFLINLRSVSATLGTQRVQ